MTAPPKIKPTRSGVGLDETGEVFPPYNLTTPDYSESFLDEVDRISSAAEKKLEYLIIPNTPTAKNQLQAFLDIKILNSVGSKERFSLTWRGAKKLPNGKWTKSDTPYYSVPEAKKDDLSRALVESIPLTEIEFRKILVPPPIPKHVQKAQKIQTLGDQYNEALKAIEAKEAEELADAKRLLDEDDIPAVDYVDRTKEIWGRYAKEKQFLADNANRNYRAADAIHDDGERADESEVQQIVTEFNCKFSIIEIPFGILEFHDQVFSIQKKRDFKDRFQNRKIAVSEKKSVSVADVWLDAPERRTFFRIEFRPDKTPGEYLEEGHRYLNLWKGFGVQPKKGDCTLIKHHMLEVICAGDKQNFDYLWNLESTWVQRPSERTTVPVLRSQHGAGKGRHTDLFSKIFSDSFLETSRPEDVFGNFNALIANKVLIHLDDAIFGGDKRLMGKLKTFSTAAKINIEFKGKDPIVLHNPRKLIISSNEDFAIPVEATERRYFFLDVANHRIGDEAYFHNLTDEMENGGVEAFLYELLATDISGFNPKQLPDGVQRFGFENKIASADSFSQFLFAALQQETFFLDVASGTWEECIRLDVMEAQYLIFCKDRNLRSLINGLWGKTMQAIFGCVGLEKHRPRCEGVPKWSYKIPPIEKCKEAFASHFKTTVECAFGKEKCD